MIKLKKEKNTVTHHNTLEIFYWQISQDEFQVIKNVLIHTYEAILDVVPGGELEVPPQAYHRQRNQYDAERLLRFLLSKKQDLSLWIIPQDLYTKNMNFIFGLAYYLQGAVLSLFRLSTKELREKEAIHEVGHVLGLPHCTNQCVMQYSNSLWEAQMKPLFLCEDCRQKIKI